MFLKLKGNELNIEAPKNRKLGAQNPVGTEVRGLVPSHSFFLGTEEMFSWGQKRL